VSLADFDCCKNALAAVISISHMAVKSGEKMFKIRSKLELDRGRKEGKEKA